MKNKDVIFSPIQIHGPLQTLSPDSIGGLWTQIKNLPVSPSFLNSYCLEGRSLVFILGLTAVYHHANQFASLGHSSLSLKQWEKQELGQETLTINVLGNYFIFFHLILTMIVSGEIFIYLFLK